MGPMYTWKDVIKWSYIRYDLSDRIGFTYLSVGSRDYGKKT
jgi:hypothetical protein